jgi:hypothetical protein
LTKFAPAFIAAALTPSSRSTFSLIGTSIAFFSIGVAHDTSPTPLAGASFTGSPPIFEFAFAIATAWRAAFATASVVSALVAAKPQVPFAITRMPTPSDSVLTTFWTLSSRVNTNWLQVAADARVAVRRARVLRGLHRGVGELLLEPTSIWDASASAAIARPYTGTSSVPMPMPVIFRNSRRSMTLSPDAPRRNNRPSLCVAAVGVMCRMA